MKYFTIKELTKSETAERKGIMNVPLPEQKANLTTLVNNVLDPLREAYGKPIIVTSGFRSPLLNKAVGGANTSQHLKGEAADIVPRDKEDMMLLFNLAKELPEFDQLINEKPDKNCVPSWIHISYSSNNNRKQILTIR